MNGLSWEDDGAQEGLLTRRSAQNCLTDYELDEFLFDRLSGVTREVIEEHLLVCAQCQDRVEAEADYRQTFKDAARRIEAEDFEKAMRGEAAEPRSGWRESFVAGWSGMFRSRAVLALAGAAVVAVGLFYGSAMRHPSAETEVALSLARGAGDVVASAPAGGALKLSANVSELPPMPIWRVDVVNATGALEQTSEIAAAGHQLSMQLKSGLPAGRHWVRLRNASNGSLVREFGLMVR